MVNLWRTLNRLNYKWQLLIVALIWGPILWASSRTQLAPIVLSLFILAVAVDLIRFIIRRFLCWRARTKAAHIYG